MYFDFSTITQFDVYVLTLTNYFWFFESKTMRKLIFKSWDNIFSQTFWPKLGIHDTVRKSLGIQIYQGMAKVKKWLMILCKYGSTLTDAKVHFCCWVWTSTDWLFYARFINIVLFDCTDWTKEYICCSGNAIKMGARAF